jgi:cytochrome c553
MKPSFYSLIILVLVAVAPVWAQTGDAAAGQTKVAVCSACHGMDGKGILPLYPNIGGQGEAYMYKQILDIKEGRRTVIEMAPFTLALSDQDMLDLAAYYASQPMQLEGAQPIESEPHQLDSDEFLSLGESVFRAGNLANGIPACTGCHSPSGQGNFPAGFPALSGQKTEYLMKQLSDFQNNLRTNDGDTRIMRGVVERMSALEIEAVANFISGLN